MLETANVKQASAATDVLGKSGRSMLDAELRGQEYPEILAELVRGRLRSKLPDLRKALDGRVRPHHQVLLARILTHIDFLEEALVQLQKEMEQYLDPFAEAMLLVQSVVGIKERAAASIIAEIGMDMTRFASDKHLASWAGVCPGNKQIGGKRLSGKQKAITALAHKVLVIIYHLLRAKKPYTDLGADYFNHQERGRIERHHLHRLEQLGYTVTLTPEEAA